MEVIDAAEALLSDWEVLELLRAQKNARDTSPAHSPLRTVPENVHTVELEAIRHLERSAGAPRATSRERMARLLAGVRGLPLSREEKLQLANLVPRNRAELFTVVVGCEERLSDEDVERLLGLCAELFPDHFAATDARV